MSRIENRKLVHTTTYQSDIIYRCDKCNKVLDPDSIEDNQPNELIVLLNAEECVNQRFRKDLCTECLEPIWQAICEALGVDPDDTSGSDFNDDY